MLKRLLPRTLLGRAVIIIVAPVVLLLVVATVIFYERHWDTVTRRLALGVAGDIALIIDNLDALDSSGELEDFLRSARRQLLLEVTFDAGATLPAAQRELVSNRILDSMLTQALAERLDEPFRIDTVSFGEYIEIRVQIDDGVLAVRTLRERVTSSTTYIFLMWMVGSSLVLVTVAIVFLRNQIRPIRSLAAAADAFGKGREVPDFRTGGALEVRRAAAAFNTMRKRIQRFVAQRTEMLAGVSHDLRTPLTRMRLQLAMLPAGGDTENLKSDVDEMEAMLEGYLAFARYQDTETAVEVDLPALLEQVAANARRGGGNVALQTGRDLMVPLHPNAFLRCMTNLVDNAQRYAEHVAITAHRVDGVIEIFVDDDGPGIPPEKREEVFRPFRRLEESRNPETGGSGLGLAIAQDVVRSHGGELSLTTAPQGGLRAVLRVPV